MKLTCCKNKKDEGQLDDVVHFLKAISEVNRLKILCLLREKEHCVCDIWHSLDLPQNLISHHLKVLKDFDLVDSRKDGTRIIYSLRPENTEKYISLLSHYI